MIPKEHKYRKIDVITHEEMVNKLLEKEECNGLSFFEVRDIVDTFFSCLKEDLRNNKLYIYRSENLGTFYINLKRAKSCLKATERNVEKGKITKERGEEIKKMLNEFIDRKS